MTSMKNPWLKKNPLMSIWLSAANATFGSARGRATAVAHRQAAQMVAEAQRQMLQFWTGTRLHQGKRRKK